MHYIYICTCRTNIHMFAPVRDFLPNIGCRLIPFLLVSFKGQHINYRGTSFVYWCDSSLEVHCFSEDLSAHHCQPTERYLYRMPAGNRTGIYFTTGHRANQLDTSLSTTNKTTYCISAFSKGTGDVRKIVLSLLTHDRLENSIFLKHTGSL
jgi:hypothetical protein